MISSHCFSLAPSPREVRGGLAVPVDFERVEAQVTLDAKHHIARAVAAVEFELGKHSGFPIFDLRQSVETARLDGRTVSAKRMTQQVLGRDPKAHMRVLQADLEAHSRHRLELEYELRRPRSERAVGIEWDGVEPLAQWDFFMSDLAAGRYLEQWFPSNLIWDRFAFSLELRIEGSHLAHKPITNGNVRWLEKNHWRIEFPESFTAFCPMLVLAPLRLLETRESNGLTLAQHAGAGADLGCEEDRIRGWLGENARTFGPYPHGDRFTAFLWSQPRSMEYAGAVTSSVNALEHEVFHSWWGRGVKPASQNDGWIDEAWAMWNTEPDRWTDRCVEWDDPPMRLCTDDPYHRVTPLESYREGVVFLAGLAGEVGIEELMEMMADLYRLDPLQQLTTSALQQWIGKRAPKVNVRRHFDRFVYGLTK